MSTKNKPAPLLQQIGMHKSGLLKVNWETGQTCADPRLWIWIVRANEKNRDSRGFAWYHIT